jgi:hypothetical protein
MDFLGSLPQWVTALIAGGALWVGYQSIQSQREIARKRAATDFFARTEMDENALNAHKKFTAAVEHMQTHRHESLDQFVKSQQYKDIRSYLNLHELMAVGIAREVFDDNVCYDFWSGELGRAYASTRILIDYVQSRPGEEDTYIELVKVANRWAKRETVMLGSKFIWADRVAIGALVLSLLAIIELLATGTVNLSNLAIATANTSGYFSDTEMGIGSPTFLESVRLVSAVGFKVVGFAVLPLWVILRVFDFVIHGKIRIQT